MNMMLILCGYYIVLTYRTMVQMGTLPSSSKYSLNLKVLCKFKLPAWSVLLFPFCEGWNQGLACDAALSLSCKQDLGLNLNSAIPAWIRRWLRFRLLILTHASAMQGERGTSHKSKRSSHTHLTESLSWQEICCHACSSSGTRSAQLL